MSVNKRNLCRRVDYFRKATHLVFIDVKLLSEVSFPFCELSLGKFSDWGIRHSLIEVRRMWPHITRPPECWVNSEFKIENYGENTSIQFMKSCLGRMLCLSFKCWNLVLLKILRCPRVVGTLKLKLLYLQSE